MIMQKAGRVLSCLLLFHGHGITIASDRRMLITGYDRSR